MSFAQCSALSRAFPKLGIPTEDCCSYGGVSCSQDGQSILAISFGGRGRSIDGPIGASLAELTSLTYIDINNLNVNGGIDVFRAMPQLRFLGLYANSLSGDLPSWLGDDLPNIMHFNVQWNQFTGTLPESVSKWTNLQLIGLGNNGLTGSVPSSYTKANWPILQQIINNMPIYGTLDPNFLGTVIDVRESCIDLPASLLAAPNVEQSRHTSCPAAPPPPVNVSPSSPPVNPNSPAAPANPTPANPSPNIPPPRPSLPANPSGIPPPNNNNNNNNNNNPPAGQNSNTPSPANPAPLSPSDGSANSLPDPSASTAPGLSTGSPSLSSAPTALSSSSITFFSAQIFSSRPAAALNAPNPNPTGGVNGDDNSGSDGGLGTGFVDPSNPGSGGGTSPGGRPGGGNGSGNRNSNGGGASSSAVLPIALGIGVTIVVVALAVVAMFLWRARRKDANGAADDNAKKLDAGLVAAPASPSVGADTKYLPTTVERPSQPARPAPGTSNQAPPTTSLDTKTGLPAATLVPVLGIGPATASEPSLSSAPSYTSTPSRRDEKAGVRSAGLPPASLSVPAAAAAKAREAGLAPATRAATPASSESAPRTSAPRPTTQVVPAAAAGDPTWLVRVSRFTPAQVRDRLVGVGMDATSAETIEEGGLDGYGLLLLTEDRLMGLGFDADARAAVLAAAERVRMGPVAGVDDPREDMAPPMYE
ncbi:hypothetical protein HDU96_009499 [Phlyctochytrium bullatum]|nr:hypothetical protein HDU96_009499 [Phlyctochytrium bullatum]